jgi:hypothetical protein
MASWGDAQPLGTISFDDVVYVLGRSNGVSRDRVLWLRSQIWWTLNNRFRRGPDHTSEPNELLWPRNAEQSNMEALLAMLREGEVRPQDMIQQGELLRLLGRFDEAIAVLKSVPPDGYSEVRAVKIERLARSGDTHVRLLSSSTY